MTVEKAIETIRRYECNQEHYYACEMAINALEQLPCEDAVSRQAVLSKIKEVCFGEEWVKFRIDNGSNGQRDFLTNYIEQLPSVTPQRKVGRWVILKDEYDDITEAVCSCCDKHGNPKWAFCPKCGARMEDGEDT